MKKSNEGCFNKNSESLDNELMCALETFNIRQKLFAFIQYANNDKVKIFQDFHEKVELLTK